MHAAGQTQAAPSVHDALGASPQWQRQSRLELGALASAVPCARLHTKHILREWHLDPLADSAEIIVSELTTNALHASWALAEPQPVTLRLLASHQQLMIQVWDAHTAPPNPQPHALDADGGRGLEIVSLLSDAWGFYHPASGGKIVWATLASHPTPGTDQSASP